MQNIGKFIAIIFLFQSKINTLYLILCCLLYVCAVCTTGALHKGYAHTWDRKAEFRIQVEIDRIHSGIRIRVEIDRIHSGIWIRPEKLDHNPNWKRQSPYFFPSILHDKNNFFFKYTLMGKDVKRISGKNHFLYDKIVISNIDTIQI